MTTYIGWIVATAVIAFVSGYTTAKWLYLIKKEEELENCHDFYQSHIKYIKEKYNID